MGGVSAEFIGQRLKSGVSDVRDLMGGDTNVNAIRNHTHDPKHPQPLVGDFLNNGLFEPDKLPLLHWRLYDQLKATSTKLSEEYKAKAAKHWQLHRSIKDQLQDKTLSKDTREMLKKLATQYHDEATNAEQQAIKAENRAAGAAFLVKQRRTWKQFVGSHCTGKSLMDSINAIFFIQMIGMLGLELAIPIYHHLMKSSSSNAQNSSNNGN